MQIHPSVEGVTLRTRFCRQGHDKLRVGLKDRRCKACANRRRNRRRAVLRAERYGVPLELAAYDGYLPGLRDTRERLGLSQRHLARLAGVRKATIGDAERGLRRPHPATVQKLILALAPLLARERILERASSGAWRADVARWWDDGG